LTNVFPFPVGLFSESEWRDAYRLCLNETDACREAAWNAAVTADQAERSRIDTGAFAGAVIGTHGGDAG
jgi:hypothetical protein